MCQGNHETGLIIGQFLPITVIDDAPRRKDPRVARPITLGLTAVVTALDDLQIEHAANQEKDDEGRSDEHEFQAIRIFFIQHDGILPHSLQMIIIGMAAQEALLDLLVDDPNKRGHNEVPANGTQCPKRKGDKRHPAMEHDAEKQAPHHTQKERHECG